MLYLLFILSNLSVYGADRERLIIQYFWCGYAYSLIISFLYFCISVSLRQLKRILKRLNLGRRRKIDGNMVRQTTLPIRVSIVFGIICTSVLIMWCLLIIHQKDFQGSGRLLGYRSLWRRLQNRHGVYVPRYM